MIKFHTRDQGRVEGVSAKIQRISNQFELKRDLNSFQLLLGSFSHEMPKIIVLSWIQSEEELEKMASNQIGPFQIGHK